MEGRAPAAGPRARSRWAWHNAGESSHGHRQPLPVHGPRPRRYQWIQGTRPQTLAYGLSDSPAGLAAWIVEKLQRWTDCGGDVERSIGRDDILTDVTIYWVTGTINASFWPYCDRMHRGWPLPEGRIAVPTGYAEFPREILRPPRAWAERQFDLRRWTRMPRGGHFAALEEPDLLTEDVRAFFGPLRRG